VGGRRHGYGTGEVELALRRFGSYGTGEVELALRRFGRGYVLGAGATQLFNSWIGKPEVAGTAEAIARDLQPSAWVRLSAGEGTKGPRLYDWAYLELADLEADAFNPALVGTWTRGLLIRRNLTGGELAFFSTWCPAGTAIQTLVAVEGRRWAIEGAPQAQERKVRDELTDRAQAA